MDYKEVEIPNPETDINVFLGQPTDGVLDTLARLEGDVAILGAGGKMGPTITSMLCQGFRQLGKRNRVLAVSRFSDPESADLLRGYGAEILSCDLIDREAVQQLPEVDNILFLAGHKFGATSAPELTWAMNTIVPALKAEKFTRTRMVVFSTGCVYPFVPVESGGSREDDEIGPIGDYANSCVGRERVFTFYSKRNGTPLSIYRLNYAIDLRYGVLVDIATKVLNNEPVDVSTGHVNVIWQGDAAARAIQLLDHASSPPFILNVTGPETITVRDLATAFGEKFDKKVRFIGKEQPTAWLSNAAKSMDLFGPLTVSLEQMIDYVAQHLQNGGKLLGKPTHFEARSGKF